VIATQQSRPGRRWPFRICFAGIACGDRCARLDRQAVPLARFVAAWLREIGDWAKDNASPCCRLRPRLSPFLGGLPPLMIENYAAHALAEADRHGEGA